MKESDKMWKHEKAPRLEQFIEFSDLLFFILWFFALPIFLVILLICILLNM